MLVTINSNRTLLLGGPAFFTVTGGEASILGGPLTENQTVTVRKDRSIPVYSVKGATLDVSLGGDSTMLEVEGNTIPCSWTYAAEKILDFTSKKKVGVMIIGGVDAGKTSFTIFLVNCTLRMGLKVNIIDEDVGQSDIGPPGTIGSCTPTRYLQDLFYEKPNKLVFMGVTTPSKAQMKIIDVTVGLFRESLKEYDLTVLNTDGWLDGEEAKRFKVNMTEELKPDWVVVIRSSNGIILRETNIYWHTVEVEPSLFVKKRSVEARRRLRIQAYQRYLRNSIQRVLFLDEIQIRGEDKLEKNSLVGLNGSIGEFLGIGMLREVDFNMGLIKVLTPVKLKVTSIDIGETTVDL